ncbi:Sec-independent protein translocase subunit TatA [Janibacter sp. Soil728]|uniref:Sec-independent protein translocase subunit TatA n=1 Tax=Janibacter sp. Soil728 TaxID=1736393 RepID=UPI001F1FAEDB
MEIILILVVILLLFGFKKLPDAARSVGKSARVFKSEVNEMKEEDRQREEAKKSRETGTAPTSTTPTTDGNAIDEARPRTDDQSGPVA